MRHKFFTIPALIPGEAETELNNFCAQHCVVNVEKQWLVNGENSVWSVCVTWLPSQVSISNNARVQDQRKARVDYREVLSNSHFQQYSQLRDLRRTLAERDGVPVYNIFTNEQLASMVRQKIISKAVLLKLEGVGQMRVEKYSELFFKQVQQFINDEASIY